MLLLYIKFCLINYTIFLYLFILMLVCTYIAWRIFERNYTIRISILLGTLFKKPAGP